MQGAIKSRMPRPMKAGRDILYPPPPVVGGQGCQVARCEVERHQLFGGDNAGDATELIGSSIRAGKRADFVILAEDPMTAAADALRGIKVKATIFSGKAYPTP